MICNECYRLYKINILKDNNTMVCDECNKYDFVINDDIIIKYINEYPTIWFFYNKDYNKFKLLLYKSYFLYIQTGNEGAMCLSFYNNFLITFPIKNIIDNL